MLIWSAWWLFRQPDAFNIVSAWLASLKQQPLLYAIILFAVTALMLPPFALIIMGGFLYGPVAGTIISSFAYLFGAIVSFYIGQHFGKELIARLARRRPGIHALNVAIERKGMLIVLLARLALVLPYNILNVVLGASHAPLKPYIVGTWLGTLPVIIANSILGSSAPGLIEIMRGNVKLEIDGQIVFAFGIGVLLTLIFIVRWSNKQLQREISLQNDDS